MELPTTLDEVNETPDNYPWDWVEDVTLQNDLQVTIRPIRPDDGARLQEGFQRLSSQSRYLRFLETSNELSDKQARELSNLDHDTRMALVAETTTDEGVFLGCVARYATLGPEGARSSERRDREGRRLGLERRRTERRVAERRVQNMWIATEKRSGLDRRHLDDRRTGFDRRV